MFRFILYAIFVFIINFYLTFGFRESEPLNIVSIINEKSLAPCLIKVFSIIKSSYHPENLFFRFLLFESELMNKTKWDNLFHSLFPYIKHQTKVWIAPKELKILKNTRFETEIIFCRFYLPKIFKVKRLFYLDNDIIVTANIDLVSSIKLLSSSWKNVPFHTRRQTKGVLVHKFPIGFVFEHHPYYQTYIKSNFNLSNHLVKSTIRIRGDKVFFNAGVFLIDCILWNKMKLTEKAIDLIQKNRLSPGNTVSNSSVYYKFYSPSVGDQGLFFILLGDYIAYLHPSYNIRRIPAYNPDQIKSGIPGIFINYSLVNNNYFHNNNYFSIFLFHISSIQGIYHFAGAMGRDFEMLCRHPLRYPRFLQTLTPLYLSVVNEFIFKFKDKIWNLFESPNECIKSVHFLISYLKNHKLTVRYRSIKSNFPWPPPIVLN